MRQRGKVILSSVDVFHDLGLGAVHRAPTVKEIVEKTGMHYYTLRRMLAGISDPHCSTLQRIADALGVDFCDLYHAVQKARARRKALQERDRALRYPESAKKVTPLT